MLKEQHLRKVEECLVEALQAAKIADMSHTEVLETLKALMEMPEDL